MLPRLPAIAALGAILLWAWPAAAQQTAPQPAGPAPAKPAPSKRDYSQEPFVIEQYHVRARFENDGTVQREMQVRIRVQSEAGVRQLGQLVFGYNSANERLEIDSVEVRKADGAILSALPDAVQDLTAPLAREAPVYTDLRQKHVTVPGLRPGEMLAYHLSVRIHTPPAPGHFWLEHDFLKDAIVLDEQLEVNLPRNRTVKLKTQPGADPVVIEEGDRKIFRWKSSHLEREEEDKGDAKPKKKAPKKPEAPAVQLTTFQSWEEVGRWYAGLAYERATPTEAIRVKAQELVRGRATDLEKTEALYDFVAKNFRYVSLPFGLGRYQPHAAAEVLANQYGDCKDKHALLEELAKAVGLRAYPVLIHSSRKIDPEIPSPAQFDHVFTAIPLGGEWIWLDTTTEVAPFRLLPSSLRKKQALLIPTGAAAPGPAGMAEGVPRLVETPADPPFPATQRVDVDAQVSELGKLTAAVRYTLRGDTELLLRLAFRRTPQNQWKQLGQLLAISDGFRGEVSEVKGSDPAATREPFQVEYRIAQPGYLDWSSKKSQLALPLPAVGLPGVPEAEEENEADAEPVELGTPLDITTQVVLELPANYAAHAPVAMAVMRDYAEYRSSYKVEGNRITAERILRFKLRELPASRSRDYLAFARAVRADEGQSLALEVTSAASPGVPPGAGATELSDAALASLSSGDYRTAEQLFQRVVELEPEHKQAWSHLGRALLAQSKLTEAAAAFRKQLEVNPSDPHIRDLLGQALARNRKSDEAVEVFRQQLELHPRDLEAQFWLGNVYLNQRKFADAVAVLEKAVELSPEEPTMHLTLGRALIKNGQTERGVAELSKAVELRPTPTVWTDVASDLSEANVQLDRALHYAESAVTATAAQLNNVELEKLSQLDLFLVYFLSVSWGTQGRIFYQRGELDRAEKFLEASWQLNQQSDVGDGLAELYEKQGRREDAIRTYAMALATKWPQPEPPAHLAALLGGEDKVEPLVQKAKEELARMNTISLGARLAEPAGADFFVQLSAGGKVEGVKFIRGSESLRPMADALRAARFPALFPDDTPVKLVRRGVLTCAADTGECRFVLAPAASTTPLD